MKKKAIKIDNNYNSTYCLFPDGFADMEDLVKNLADHPNRFIKLTKLSENTCFPYFIEEESTEIYLRLDQSAELQVVNVNLLKKEEYTSRLIKLVDKVCDGCGNYKNEKEALGEIGNLRGHWRQLNLDGYCDGFWRKGEDECD